MFCAAITAASRLRTQRPVWPAHVIVDRFDQASPLGRLVSRIDGINEFELFGRNLIGELKAAQRQISSCLVARDLLVGQVTAVSRERDRVPLDRDSG